MRAGFINERIAIGGIAPFSIAAYAAPDRGSVAQAAGCKAEIAGVTDAHGAGDGDAVDLRYLGTAEVRAGASIDQGDLLTSDDRGRAVPFAGPRGEEACILGRALGSAEEHGLCQVEFLPPGISSAIRHLVAEEV